MIFIKALYKNIKIEEYVLDLNDVSNSKHLLQRKIGTELTRALKKRYNQIVSFSNYAEFVNAHIDNTESLHGDLKGYYSMSLNANYRIVVSPETEDLSISNLKTIDKFKIIGVIDYHGTGKKDNKWLI